MKDYQYEMMKPKNLAMLNLKEELEILKIRTSNLEKTLKSWGTKKDTKKIKEFEEIFNLVKNYMIKKVENYQSSQKNIRKTLIKYTEEDKKIEYSFDISLDEMVAILKMRVNDLLKANSNDRLSWGNDYQIRRLLGRIEITFNEIKKLTKS
jgi:hypothetical protein